MAEIFKFPYDASRRVHSQKPRQSKNGTPEERAAKAAASLPPPADVVPMADLREQARSAVDGRKLRGSPLRESVAVLSFGATVVGKMHTAGLKGEPLAAIELETRKEWLKTLEQCARSIRRDRLGAHSGDGHPERTGVGNFRLSGKFTGLRFGTACPKFSKAGPSVLDTARGFVLWLSID
jgi:hypothetical protein